MRIEEMLENSHPNIVCFHHRHQTIISGKCVSYMLKMPKRRLTSPPFCTDIHRTARDAVSNFRRHRSVISSAYFCQ